MSSRSSTALSGLPRTDLEIRTHSSRGTEEGGWKRALPLRALAFFPVVRFCAVRFVLDEADNERDGLLSSDAARFIWSSLSSLSAPASGLLSSLARRVVRATWKVRTLVAWIAENTGLVC